MELLLDWEESFRKVEREIVVLEFKQELRPIISKEE